MLKSGEFVVKRFATLLFVALAFGNAAAAQTAGKWSEEFTERPAEWGGDIRYALLETSTGSSLRLGCTPNRIERVLVVFGAEGGQPAPIGQAPIVRYSIDGEPLLTTDWPLFESGSIEVPRGAESAEITQLLTTARTFRVEANRLDGGWQVAEFDLIGIEWVVIPMLEACGIK